jgi:AraC-like DNA-binding protein
MTMTPSTQSTPDRFKVPDAFWRGLELIGLSPPAVLRQARLPATLHLRAAGDRRQVNTEQFFELWRAVQALTHDAAAGLRLATSLNTGVLPPSSLVAFYARDYRDGLARLARFKQLCAPERLNLVATARDCTITVDWWQSPGEVPPLLMDATFASMVELGRRATGTRIVPRAVELARADDGRGKHADYYGCAVRFRAGRNALVLDAQDLDRPFPGHNPELLEMLSPALATALAESKAQDSMRQQVKGALKRILASGRPEMSAVARELGMSERTLQRRITEEGTSFRQLLLEARQEIVRQLLAEPSIDLSEIAYLVGYEDVNSFFRAFRSWEGTTPARWRERQARAGSPGLTH